MAPLKTLSFSLVLVTLQLAKDWNKKEEITEMTTSQILICTMFWVVWWNFTQPWAQALNHSFVQRIYKKSRHLSYQTVLVLQHSCSSSLCITGQVSGQWYSLHHEGKVFAVLLHHSKGEYSPKGCFETLIQQLFSVLLKLFYFYYCY